jgi:hypothetical protein
MFSTFACMLATNFNYGVALKWQVTVHVLAMVGIWKTSPAFAQMPDRITNVEFTTVCPSYCQCNVQATPTVSSISK